MADPNSQFKKIKIGWFAITNTQVTIDGTTYATTLKKVVEGTPNARKFLYADVHSLNDTGKYDDKFFQDLPEICQDLELILSYFRDNKTKASRLPVILIGFKNLPNTGNDLPEPIYLFLYTFNSPTILTSFSPDGTYTIYRKWFSLPYYSFPISFNSTYTTSPIFATKSNQLHCMDTDASTFPYQRDYGYRYNVGIYNAFPILLKHFLTRVPKNLDAISSSKQHLPPIYPIYTTVDGAVHHYYDTDMSLDVPLWLSAKGDSSDGFATMDDNALAPKLIENIYKRYPNASQDFDHNLFVIDKPINHIVNLPHYNVVYMNQISVRNGNISSGVRMKIFATNCLQMNEHSFVISGANADIVTKVGKYDFFSNNVQNFYEPRITCISNIFFGDSPLESTINTVLTNIQSLTNQYTGLLYSFAGDYMKFAYVDANNRLHYIHEEKNVYIMFTIEGVSRINNGLVGKAKMIIDKKASTHEGTAIYFVTDLSIQDFENKNVIIICRLSSDGKSLTIVSPDDARPIIKRLNTFAVERVSSDNIYWYELINLYNKPYYLLPISQDNSYYRIGSDSSRIPMSTPLDAERSFVPFITSSDLNNGNDAVSQPYFFFGD